MKRAKVDGGTGPAVPPPLVGFVPGKWTLLNKVLYLSVLFVNVDDDFLPEWRLHTAIHCIGKVVARNDKMHHVCWINFRSSESTEHTVCQLF